MCVEQRPFSRENPCIPSPCGPYSVCRAIGDTPACSCLPNYVGRAPNCRPECTISAECPANLACLNERCKDPCPGSCGLSASCHVVNHSPACSCLNGYTGDPFSGCHPVPSKIDTIAFNGNVLTWFTINTIFEKKLNCLIIFNGFI